MPSGTTLTPLSAAAENPVSWCHASLLKLDAFQHVSGDDRDAEGGTAVSRPRRGFWRMAGWQLRQSSGAMSGLPFGRH